MQDAERNRQRPVWRLALAAIFILFGLTALTSLGIWQIERRAWKLDLIHQVGSRAHAAPEAAPGPDSWPTISARNDAYRHVKIRGVFLHDRETPVQAVTIFGPGFWIMTPLRADAGFIVLINRGFVPYGKRDPATRSAGQIEGETIVTGLLRITEPKGRFLRPNDPATDLWYARDVAAIAEKRGLSGVAPYFIDADAATDAGNLPAGGLTVIYFPNNHLIYAITWFSLDIMLAVFAAFAVRDEMRRRR